MRTLAGLLLAASILIGGCASIPLSTAVRLSKLDTRSLAQIDPDEVRVRLSVPVGYELDLAKSRLTFVLTETSGESHSAEMTLKRLQTTHESRPGGWFSADVPVSTHLLALSADGVRQLREIQRIALSDQVRDFQFSVQSQFSRIPDDAQALTFWADLKLSPQEPFMPLIDGAKIKLERQPAGS
jgi:hypothetical protein